MKEDSQYQDCSGFWQMIDRLYRRRDAILEATDALLDCADMLDLQSASNKRPTPIEAEYRSILTSGQKTIDTIISYACSLAPHLKDPNRLTHLREVAQTLTIKMSMSDSHLTINAPFIVLGLRQFALLANQLEINPTRRSLKAAFGIDVGVEAARIRALLETKKSNW